MRIFQPDDFSGDDTNRVQRAVDAAIDNYGRAYFPWKGRPYEIEDTITIRPKSNEDQATLVMEGDPVWKLFEYHGAPKKSIFKSFGLKTSTLRNIAIRSFASETIGYEISGDSETRSSSGNLFENLRFQSEPDTFGTTGFVIGSGGDDHSCNSFFRCSVAISSNENHSRRDFLKVVSEGAHTGFAFLGGNTLAQSLRDCYGFGQRVLFKLADHLGKFPGGSRTLFDNCAGTSCLLGYQIDGGFGAQIRGGRWELGGCILVHGNLKKPGRGRATLLISCLTTDAMFPDYGSFSNLFERGELIGIRSDAEVILEGCEFMGDNIGERLQEHALFLASNSQSEPRIHLIGNQGLPIPNRTMAGKRRLILDGVEKILMPGSG